MKLTKFAWFAWGVLAFNILVILWGAFVRATGSGAGCGSHWPSCQGEVFLWPDQIETIIEFTHRLTSGLAFLLVLAMLIWAIRRYPKGHVVRLGAGLSMVFMIIESLVGAGLVLFELVAYNTSIARAVVMAIHLVNTFLLLSALTLTAWWASGGRPLKIKGQGKLGWALGVGYVGVLILGASGGVTALGDTLYPAESLTQGIQQELSSTAHFLVRLRLYHPIVAVATGAYLVGVMVVFNTKRPNPTAKTIAKVFVGVYLVQLVFGAFNVVLLAPVWMQIVHLFISDIILIVLVLFIAAAFAQPAPIKEPIGDSPVSEDKKVYV